MKYWSVYKRGDVYRIARPGWLFWHWYRFLCYVDESKIYETRFRSEAVSTCNGLNNQLDSQARFKRGRWEID